MWQRLVVWHSYQNTNGTQATSEVSGCNAAREVSRGTAPVHTPMTAMCAWRPTDRTGWENSLILSNLAEQTNYQAVLHFKCGARLSLSWWENTVLMMEDFWTTSWQWGFSQAVCWAIVFIRSVDDIIRGRSSQSLNFRQPLVTINASERIFVAHSSCRRVGLRGFSHSYLLAEGQRNLAGIMIVNCDECRRWEDSLTDKNLSERKANHSKYATMRGFSHWAPPAWTDSKYNSMRGFSHWVPPAWT